MVPSYTMHLWFGFSVLRVSFSYPFLSRAIVYL